MIDWDYERSRCWLPRKETSMTDPLQPALVSADELLELAKAINAGIYAATPSVRVLARDYIKLKLALVSEAPREDGLAAIIADLEEALAVESTRRHGICGECGVDHDNEARLNRAVIALTLRRLRKLSASRTPLSALQGSLRGEESDAEFDAAVDTIRASQTPTTPTAEEG